MKLLPLFCLAFAAANAAEIVPAPTLPLYGEGVAIELTDTTWPMYLPATRYTRVGPVIEIEYEYRTDGFGPSRPDFGLTPLWLGELAPGNYEVRARLFDIDAPSAAPLLLSTNIAVRPPTDWGIYVLPQAPQAFAATQAIVRSAAYFDPATLTVTLSGNVVRVEFDYVSDQSEPAPPGTSTFGSVRIPPLAPGAYLLEGWGRASMGAGHEKFFTRDLDVAATVPVVEFYSAFLRHYFIAAGIDEIDLLDRGDVGWKRTGQGFSAWLRQADAPAGAVPVCRFYAHGPNSHFYTGSASECASLRALEQVQRGEALTRGEAFLGWAYEATAFWAMVPTDGVCPGGTTPVFRAYNNRANQMDSNHRFMANPSQRDAMTQGWLDEGTQLCSAP